MNNTIIEKSGVEMFDDSQNQPQIANTDTVNTQSSDAGAPPNDNTASSVPGTFPPVSTDNPAGTGDLIAPTSPPTIGANDSNAFDPSVLDSVMNDSTEQTTDNSDSPTPTSTASDIPSETSLDTPPEIIEPSTSSTADHIAASSTDAPSSSSDTSDTTSTSSDSSGLLDIKQRALQELSPLVGKLDQTPEEKFRTTMMMIQASDDQSLINAAYEAANTITDDKARAQALLDVINEINYFSNQSKSDKD